MNIWGKIAWRARLWRRIVKMALFYDLDFRSSLSYALKETFSRHPPSTYFQKKYPVELLSQDGEFCKYRIKDIIFHLPKGFSPDVFPSFYDEVFDRRIYELGMCRIEPGDWVIDAGSCEGFFSLYALGKGANVIAFEPVAELAKALEITLNPYIKVGRAKVIQVALGDEVKEERILLDFVNSGSSVLQDSDRGGRPQGAQCSVIKVETLDNLYGQGVIDKVSFIKADVEGYERKLLKGAEKVVKTFRPKLALCYYHVEDDLEVLSKIISSFKLGYKMAINKEVLFAW